MLPFRRTKTVATIGPASSEPAILERLVRAGVDVFRLNLSHGTHDQHRLAFAGIRAAAQLAGVHVAILADLCGPKIRVGIFAAGSIELDAGHSVTVTTRDILGGPGVIPCAYPSLSQDVKPGDLMRLDDGLLELRVDSIENETEVYCTVVTGGILKDRKGMNLPGVNLSTPSLTEKDKTDAQFALELGIDFLALSFVRKAQDVQDLREFIGQLGGAETPIIAKIEKPQALDEIDAILEQADGIMIARGDLGVELPPEKIPIVQAALISKARLASKPVIVATQMLESMVLNQIPTRAEVSDVSTAVLAGADAVMLSAETSVGAYPVQAVQMIDRIARQMESWMYEEDRFRSLTPEVKALARAGAVPYGGPLRPALARSLAQLSRDLKVPAVVVRSQTGTSARVVSATRPAAPIVVLSTEEKTARRLNLVWGLLPQVVGTAQFEQPRPTARQIVAQLGLAQAGEMILLLSGVASDEPSVTVLKV